MLLVDNIITTGATLAPCSDALVKAAAWNGYFLTLASALPHHGPQIV